MRQNKASIKSPKKTALSGQLILELREIDFVSWPPVEGWRSVLFRFILRLRIFTNSFSQREVTLTEFFQCFTSISSYGDPYEPIIKTFFCEFNFEFNSEFNY